MRCYSSSFACPIHTEDRKEPHIRECEMRDERLRDSACGIVVVKNCVSHLSVTVSLKSECKPTNPRQT